MTHHRTKQSDDARFAWWEEENEGDLSALLTRLEIVSRRQVEGLFAGSYRSAFLGRGMDFAEVRPYQPGDEIRWIDWNVSARMDEIYVKQFVEERERTVLLVWDASASMDLGSHWRSKRELGAELGMILAMSALANQDRVGLLLFGERVERYVAPEHGRKSVMRMIREILAYRPETPESSRTPATNTETEEEPGSFTAHDDASASQEASTRTDLEAALQFLLRVAPRHSIVFVMSDFLAPIEKHAWQRLARRCEVIPVVIRDPMEQTLSPGPLPSAQIWSELPTWMVGGSLLLFLLWSLSQGGAWLWSAVTGLALWFLGTLYFSTLSSKTMVELRDLETGTHLPVELRRFRRKDGGYHLPLSPAYDDVLQLFQQLGLDVVELQTDKDPGDALRAFFSQRQRMSGR